MKNLFLTVVFLCVVALYSNAQTTGLVNSTHNFASSTVWNTSGEMCKPCHIPHNAISGMTLIWNHTLSTANYTVYNTAWSSTINATVGQPDGTSKLCLSCHDGTVALSNFNGSGSTAVNIISTSNKLGTNLTDDHPVSFLYDAALATADGNLANPVTANSGMGHTIDVDMLSNHKVQCTSCHDVHNHYGIYPLLKMSNANSALCTTCHTL